MWNSIGFDFGDENCVFGIFRNNGVDILTNQFSKRLTQTMVTYSQTRRYIGEEAHQQQFANISSTFTHLKAILSIPFTNPIRQKLSTFLPYDLVQIGQFTGISLNYNNETLNLYPEQCLSFLFKSLDQTLVKPNLDPIGYVISVPPSWTELQRRSLVMTSRLSGLNLLSLLSSNTAAALTYLHQKGTKHLDEDNLILFVDVGSSSMNISLNTISSDSIKVISYSSSSNLGGSRFDELFANYLISEVKKKYSIDPTVNKQSFIRFLESVVKTKRNLSVNKVVQFEFHSIENVEVSISVDREQFDKSISPALLEIVPLIDQCLKSAKIKKSSVTDIEVIGGSSRIISLKNTIYNYFKKVPSASMNLEECVAIGCTYYSHMLDPFTQSDIKIFDVLPYDITAAWSENANEKKLVLFNQFTPLNSKKQFNISIPENHLEINVTSLGDTIGLLGITVLRPTTNKNYLITCKIDNNGILVFLNQTDDLVLLHTPSNHIDENVVESFIALEEKMEANDSLELLIDHEKNEFEACLFEIDKISKNKTLSSNDEKYINDIKLWHEYHEFDRMQADEYTQRKEKLKEIISRISK